MNHEQLNQLEWPTPPGVYFLYHRNRVVYVGMGNVYKRPVDHCKHLKFDDTCYIKTPEEIAWYLERLYIRHFDPKYNKMKYENTPDRLIDEEVMEVLKASNVRGNIPQSVADRISALLELALRDRNEVIDRFSNEIMTWDNR